MTAAQRKAIVKALGPHVVAFLDRLEQQNADMHGRVSALEGSQLALSRAAEQASKAAAAAQREADAVASRIAGLEDTAGLRDEFNDLRKRITEPRRRRWWLAWLR